MTSVKNLREWKSKEKMRTRCSLLAVVLLATIVLATGSSVYAAMISGSIMGTPQVNSMSSLRFQRGDTLTVKVTVKNTGDTKYTFWVGLSFRDKYGRIYDASPTSITLEKGKSGTVMLKWYVSMDCAFGPLYMTTALWKGYTNGFMTGELDRWGWANIGNIRT